MQQCEISSGDHLLYKASTGNQSEMLVEVDVLYLFDSLYLNLILPTERSLGVKQEQTLSTSKIDFSNRIIVSP